MKLAEAFAPLIDLVYPPRCPSCGEAIAVQDGLCITCWEGLAIPGEPNCALCQRPFEAGTDLSGATCAACMLTPPVHDGIAAGTLYNDVSRKLVLSFKHGRRIALSRMLARMISARLPELEGEWLVVPVPLHRWRLWRRGFNQSALLAQEIARIRGKQVLVDGLVRHKPTRALGGLGRTARAKVLKGAITAHKGCKTRLKGANIVLVDDVMTSGATTDACVRALKQSGANRVVIACFARVLDEAL